MDAELTDDALHNERALRALIDSIDGVVFEYDLDLDRYVLVRGRADALLGYSPEEWCTHGFWLAHVHPEDVDRAHGFCVASIAAQRDHQFEYRMTAKDGRVVWIHDHVSLVRRAGRPSALRGVMLDVTERRAQEARLARTHERFAGLLDQFGSGLLFEDDQRRVVYANRALCQAFHVPSPAELIGRDCRAVLAQLKWAFVEPQFVERRVEELITARQAAAGLDLRLRDGRILECSYTPFELHGEPAGHLWQFVDVSVRRRADLALRDVSAATASLAGAEFFRVLVRELARALGARSAFVTECAQADPHSMATLSIWSDGDWRENRRCEAHGGPCALARDAGEYLCDGALGARFPGHFLVNEMGAQSYVGVSLRSNSSEIRGTVAVLFSGRIPQPDATLGLLRVFADRAGAELERQRAEQALRASEARYRALIEALPDIIFVVDPRGVFVDHHAPDPRQLLAPPEAFLGRRIVDVVPGALGQRFQSLVDEAFATRAPVRDVLNVERGEARSFEYRVAPLDAERALVIARDVTEQRRLEERRFQDQKLESIGRFAGGVAHDFNNLLTGILSYAELGERESGASPLAERFRRIQVAGDRAAGLTRQLLAFAREQPVEPRVVAPSELVAEMAPFLRRVLGEHVVIETSFPPAAWRTRIDPTQFYSLLTNLAVNARDALPAGGRIRITLANVNAATHDSGVSPGEYVELTVVDDGAGMDEHTRARVFEPFFTTKAKEGGAGMGLAMCYGIVHQNGGAISIVSEVGRGTCVRVLLPRCLDAATASGGGAPQQGSRGERILLVEDDAVVRDVAREALSAQGYQVLTAEDGASALRVAEQGLDELDALVTDVVMPGLGGDALAAQLRRRRPRLPVLFITGYAPAGQEAPGGGDVLRKPFAPSDLTRRVRELLDRAALAP
jgi:PAS domain S-box-containing protein